MAVIRLENVPEEVSELLSDAAKRNETFKHAYIIKQLKKIAAREYEMQQRESANE